MVIDGGPDSRVLECLARALPFGDRRVEVLLLSHPSADHYRGFRDIVDRYSVGVFVHSGLDKANLEYQALLTAIRNRGVPSREVRAGETLPLPGGQLDVLYPDSLETVPRRGDPSHDENNASIIARARLADTTALFTGDAEEPAERAVMNDGVRADILKVGHHGSRTSTSEDFADAVRPSVSVISVGAGNTYGHPTALVLGTLKRHASRVYRTDQNGTVVVSVYEHGYRVRTAR